MSMHNYGVCGYGMFLNLDEYDHFCDAYAAVNNIPADDDVMDKFYDDWAFDAGFTDLNDDTFDGRSISHLDGRQHEEDNDDFIDGFFLFSALQGGVLAKSASCSIYPDIAAMADEFRKKLGAYLPENFDCEGHLAFLCGSQCC